MVNRSTPTPRLIWRVSASYATVKGVDLRLIGPLAEQAHVGDFYFRQQGIFAIGRVFVDTRVSDHRDTDRQTSA